MSGASRKPDPRQQPTGQQTGTPEETAACDHIDRHDHDYADISQYE
jgi:hypothetical protein